MNLNDFARLTYSAIYTQRLRASLTILGIAIGIASVVLLTSIGEGIHRFVLGEFTQFGTTLIKITPGKVSTMGSSIGVFGNDSPLTLEDSEALRQVRHVEYVVPTVVGNAEIEARGLKRRTMVSGVGPDMLKAYSFAVTAGRFLPRDPIDSARALAVLGHKLRQELFGNSNPLGQRVRIGGENYRIIGIMEKKGQVLGFDLDDTIYIAAARAQSMFNREGLMEINLMYSEGQSEQPVVKGIRRLLIARHGREDFTITTQQQMLDVMSDVLNILTSAVGALGSISLLVGSVGILTIMLIAIQERTAEIGLLRALGARQSQVLWIFLSEAMILSAIGGLLGLLIGISGAQLLHALFPALPVHTPLHYVLLAELVAIVIGLLSGVLPARKAARMNPVEALRTE